jgi:hypothetical protein
MYCRNAGRFGHFLSRIACVFDSSDRLPRRTRISGRAMVRLSLNIAVVFLIVTSTAAASAGETPSDECRFAAVAPVIDGSGTDEIWKSAQRIDQFSLPWLQEQNRPASTPTSAALLWDTDNLYFVAEMQDKDLFADITKRDGDLWNNDVFELFFKPSEVKPGYYEFEVNPHGAVLDIFLPHKGVDARKHFETEPFHVDVKIALRGTLNKHQDVDQGWSVEGRIPWKDFSPTGGVPKAGDRWTYALCRYDYSTADLTAPELSTSAPLKSSISPSFHLIEDYAPLVFVGPTPKSP